MVTEYLDPAGLVDRANFHREEHNRVAAQYNALLARYQALNTSHTEAMLAATLLIANLNQELAARCRHIQRAQAVEAENERLWWLAQRAGWLRDENEWLWGLVEDLVRVVDKMERNLTNDDN